MKILLFISLLLITAMTAYMIRMKNKGKTHLNFLYLIMCCFIWDLSINMYIIFNSRSKEVAMILGYLAITFVPVFLYSTGLCLLNKLNIWSKRWYALFVIPIATNIIVWTKSYHNWFVVKEDLGVSGWYYYYIHVPYSYVLILMWFINMIKFAIKNGGYYSKQVMVIVVGSVLPFAVNVCLFLGVTKEPYWTNIAFTVTAICYFIAINKFNFLKIAPLAYSTIFNNLQDGFIVIDTEWKIIDYNKCFEENLWKLGVFERGDMLNKVVGGKKLGKFFNSKVRKGVESSRRTGEKVKFESNILLNNERIIYAVEIIPIKKDLKNLGTIILIKDITEYKTAIQLVKKTHKKMVNQEKLASLGNLIGGISHNTKTSIMSISGALEGLVDLINEYKDSVGDNKVTLDDHYEIAAEMEKWIGNAKVHLKNINDLISAVKGQAVSVNSNMTDEFTVEELLHRINILLHFELRKYECNLKVDNRVDINIVVKGEMSNLVQVLNNLISNSIYEYNKNNEIDGVIEFKIYESSEGLVLSIKDCGSGMDQEIQKNLFKEMYTTKGKNGTGLGLYISYATVTGKFDGKMWFETEKNKGTTFYIVIPQSKYTVKNSKVSASALEEKEIEKEAEKKGKVLV